MLRHVIKYRALLLMMLPALTVIAVMDYLPYFGLIIAFKDINYADGILGSPWAGLRNFRFLFATTDAWRIFRNTVAFNLVFILTGLVVTVAIAVALNEIRLKYAAKLYQTIIIMPNFLSLVVVSYVVYAFLNPDYGYVNKAILGHLGIANINWYADWKYWPFILPIVNLWKGAGIGSVIYLAAIVGIDEQLFEAARIDGATRWQQIWWITIPMIAPVIVIITILSLGGIIRSDFGLFYQVPMNSAALYAVTDTVDTYVFRALFTLNDIGMSSAANFFQSVIGLFCIVGANWLVRRISRENSLF